MVISSSIRTKSTKNMPFKIVHPGGHIELHDKPVLAAEVMLCNPRCTVAYPHVFQQPWAIVAPDTMLLLGQSTMLFLQTPSENFSVSPSNILNLQSMMSRPARPLEMMKGAVASHPLAGFLSTRT